MPVGDVLVSDTGGDVKHDDSALAVDVVSITKTTELFLAGGIPDVELNLAQVLENNCLASCADDGIDTGRDRRIFVPW